MLRGLTFILLKDGKEEEKPKGKRGGKGAGFSFPVAYYKTAGKGAENIIQWVKNV